MATYSSKKYPSGSVTSAQLADGTVVAVDLADGAITSAKLNSTVDLSGKTVTYRSIVAGDIASDAITTAKIADANITSGKLASGAAVANIGARAITAAQVPAGSVIQVVQVVKTDQFTSATSGFVDITGLSASITPSSASNKILVLATITAGAGLNNNLGFNLVRNSTNINQSTGSSSNRTLTQDYGDYYQTITSPITFLDSPSTTSATTYKIQMNSEGQTSCVINTRSTDTYYGGVSQITLMEIAV